MLTLIVFRINSYLAFVGVRNQIVVANYKIVPFAMKKTYAKDYQEEFDDLMQTGFEGFIESLNTLDLNKGKISTYAVRPIQWKVNKAIKREMFHIRFPGESSNMTLKQKRALILSTDIKSGEEGDKTDLLDVLVTDNDEPLTEKQIRIGDEFNNLNPHYKKIVWKAYVQEKRLKHIGAELGIKPKAVKDALCNIRAKIRRNMLRAN